MRCRDADDLGETSVEAFVEGLPPFEVPALVASPRKQAAAQAAQ